MAKTRNLEQMSTRKLRALLEVEKNEEQKALIQSILDERAGESEADDVEAAKADGMPVPEAEAGAEAKPEDPQPEAKPKKAARKMSEEEFLATAAEAKKAVDHRCVVKVKGTAVDLPGVVAGVFKDRRSMLVYYAVVLDPIEGVDEDPKKVYKKFGSDEITILEETVLRTRAERCKKLDSKRRNMGLSPEDFEKVLDKVLEKAEMNIGHKYNVGDGKEGRITRIRRDKKNGALYYLVTFEDEVGEKQSFRTIVWDVAEDGEVFLAEDNRLDPAFDEEAERLAQEYVERKNREPRTAKTLEEKVLEMEESLKRAQNVFAKAQETVAMRENALKVLKAQLEESLKSQDETLGEEASDYAQDAINTAKELDAEAAGEDLA